MDHNDDRSPLIGGSKPCYKELVAGRRYMWCRCGRSKRQPFCDGVHSNLPGGYQDETTETIENSTKPRVTEDAD